MIKRILHTGTYPENDDMLNRKIRISNLIALITLVVMFAYMPITLRYRYVGDMLLNFTFIAVSLLHIYLQKNRHHYLAFYISTSFGFVYFMFAPVFYGLSSNLHFFLLVMCMIVLVMFDNPYVIKSYLALALVIFFGLQWYMDGRTGIIEFTPEIAELQKVFAHINLFILFCIICIFVYYFKKDNIDYQHRIIHQKAIIEEKSQDITDSITYAKRLQDAILPSEHFMQEQLPGCFVFYRPKDIVAGDFYWMEQQNDLVLFAACDCTGHGVPGAMVSVICSNALNRAVNEFLITEPGKLLDKTRELVADTFGKSGTDVKDGMDISLCSYNRTTGALAWAGANNHLIHIRNGVLTELKGDKQPIGKVDQPRPFTTHFPDVRRGDQLYLFTDGYSDQFGGPKGKKFKYAHLKETLLKASALAADQQKLLLDDTLLRWRADLEQVDDILILGVRF